MIKIDENNNKVVTYDNDPDVERQLFPNIPLTVDISPLQDEIDALDERVGAAEDDISSIQTTLQTFNGQPVVVDSVEDMTDENIIYVYIGEEAGYTSGDWYYYNGEAWVSGGEYVANPVVIDDTLTQAGEAADAKAVGDELTQIKSDFDALITTGTDGGLWEQGTIAANTGTDASSNSRIRTKETLAKAVFGVTLTSGYSALIYAYNGSDYVGNWNGSTFIKATTGNVWFDGTIIFSSISSDYSYRLAVKKDSGDNIVPSDSSNVTLIVPTDSSLTKEFASADAKATGNAIAQIRSDVNDAINKEVLLDYGTENYSSHYGSTSGGDVYILSNEIPAHVKIIVTINTYAACNFYIGLLSAQTDNVLYGEVFALSKGVNTIRINHVPTENCYLLVDRGIDKLLYGTGTNISYSFTNGRTEYPAVDTSMSTPQFGDKANFAVGIATLLDVEYLADAVAQDATPFNGKTIFLAGDSRSSTDYTFYGTTLTAKTGANVLVKGASGTGAAYQASNEYFSRFTGTEDYVIWLTGGNDSGQYVGTFDADYPGLESQTVVTETDITQDYNGTTFIQAVDHMMRKWKSLYYDWKTLNNGHKPTLIFCSEIPQQRDNANTEWSKKVNWIRKCLAIRQCCEKNGVFYLDLYNICNFDMSFEPFWTSPTDKVTNNGLYYMDGLHPNKYGIDLITSAEIEAMKNFIRVNA